MWQYRFAGERVIQTVVLIRVSGAPGYCNDNRAHFFARYARRAAAVLARADIRRATVIERRCREMSEVSR